MATAPPSDLTLTDSSSSTFAGDAPRVAATARQPRRVGRHAPLPLRFGMFLAFVGTMFLTPQLPAHAAKVDPLIGVLVVFGLAAMAWYGSPAVHGAARTLPWLWLILVGSMLGLATVGFTGWAAVSLLQTTYALLTFFTMWHLIEVYRLEALMMRAVRLTGVLSTLILLLIDYHHRAQGYFENPNYAGHFAVTISVLLLFGSKRRSDHVLGVVTLAVALYTTASFGAMAMLLAVLTLWFARTLRRNTAVLVVVIAVVAIGAIFLISKPEPEVERQDAKIDISSGLSESRFDKSQTGRFALWTRGISQWAEHPFGLGPAGTVYRALPEFAGTDRTAVGQVHSDPLAMLIDRGVFGLVGWIGMWATIWGLARRGGVAKLLIVGFLAQAMFRETIHYRHMWFALAIAMVLDHRAAQRAEADNVTGP